MFWLYRTRRRVEGRFVHATALERAGIDRLDDGQAVSFDLERDRNGRGSAINLILA